MREVSLPFCTLYEYSVLQRLGIVGFSDPVLLEVAPIAQKNQRCLYPPNRLVNATVFYLSSFFCISMPTASIASILTVHPLKSLYKLSTPTLGLFRKSAINFRCVRFYLGFILLGSLLWKWITRQQMKTLRCILLLRIQTVARHHHRSLYLLNHPHLRLLRSGLTHYT